MCGVYACIRLCVCVCVCVRVRVCVSVCACMTTFSIWFFLGEVG
uniref:Uncharacterized protein n=1 Tax=Anguilla anguilla TaxID=7936 RepID=A0A0E9QHN3_ANGAN